MTASIIGYAQADFKTLITSGKLFIDRTEFIRLLESQSNAYQVFVRPRRFGKSLWLSILHYYYGLEHTDKFEQLFAHTAIGKSPTLLRNSYMVLRLQFAGIDVDNDDLVFQGFRANVLSGIMSFISVYRAHFSDKDLATIKAETLPANMIQMFFTLFQSKNLDHPLYILIDEYDQFANELVALDTDRYKAIIGGNGFVRKFYEMIKYAANQGVVNRFFATGVSPMTIDAMTSGFNITSSLSLELKYHDLMGFRQAEVIDILQKVGASEAEIPQLLTDLKDWYDGYLFHEQAAERLYNPDMVLYFASHYEEKKKYPRKMLDANIATDYTKVKRIFNIQNREQEFIPILKELTTEGVVSAEITEFFNLEKSFSDFDLISLLFYMGWITIKDFDDGFYSFQIPNQVIKELYYNYFIDIVEHETGLNRKATDIQKALGELARHNNPKPFLDIIKALIDIDLSLRDAQNFDEKHLKMLLIPYMSLSVSHYVVSEPEWQNSYIDLLFLKRPNITTQYNFVFELKYIKKGDTDKVLILPNGSKEKLVDKVEREAREQMNNYLKTKNAQRLTNLKAWLLILVGREWRIIAV
jgi:hypothetical protein